MIIYLLGLLDILAGISLLLFGFDINFYALFFASYLLVKGLVFVKDLVSVLDLIVGLFFFYVLFAGYYGFMAYVVVFWLIQKGIFSFLKF